MKLRSIINLAIILLLLSAGIQSIGAQAPFQGFDDYINKAMKDWEVPGMAIAIVKDDKVVYAKGYGLREMGKTAPVDERTIFAIGSSSKAFTATSIAMLVDDKKLKWDDRVTQYLPSFQLFDPYATREMTVRDLLTHRIGLERGDQLWYATAYSRDDVLRRIRYLEPSSSMRSKFGYQNIMFLAAGQIIPSVTGKSWDDFLTERIFTPLGMKDTNTTIRTLSKSTDVSTPARSPSCRALGTPRRTSATSVPGTSGPSVPVRPARRGPRARGAFPGGPRRTQDPAAGRCECPRPARWQQRPCRDQPAVGA